MNTASLKKKYVVSQKGVKSKKQSKASERLNKRDDYARKKIQRINNALDTDPVEIEHLRKLMTSPKGCVTNDVRCKVWPKLLNVNIFEKQARMMVGETELECFKENKWWRQVNLDVNRSQRRFARGIRLSRRRVLQKQLTNIIMRVLCSNSDLNYYQGYHDIGATLLRVVGEDLATKLLEQMSKTYIRDFMDHNMNRTNKMLTIFYAVLAKVDPQLEQFLVRADVGTIFALSWLITWFGHDIDSFEVVVRLFDVFLSHNPTMPVYLAVILALSKREEIMECECDMPFVHQCLCKLPSYIDDSNVEHIIKDACELFERHPPESLKYDARKYLRESDTLLQHAQLLQHSYYQKPDSVLRRRIKLGKLLNDVPNEDVSNNNTVARYENHQANPLVKAAVWTMTLSMGVMTYLVLNTNKYWL